MLAVVNRVNQWLTFPYRTAQGAVLVSKSEKVLSVHLGRVNWEVLPGMVLRPGRESETPLFSLSVSWYLTPMTITG